jgi:hypothetical protein
MLLDLCPSVILTYSMPQTYQPPIKVTSLRNVQPSDSKVKMKKRLTSTISKKLLTIFLVINIFIFFSGLSYADLSLIGEWAGTDSDGDAATFIFNDDQSAEIRFEGLPPLSTKNLANGQVIWSGNTDQDPMQLNVIIQVDSEEMSRITMIAQFVDHQTLKIQMSRDMKTRPEGFEMTASVFQILAIKQ